MFALVIISLAQFIIILYARSTNDTSKNSPRYQMLSFDIDVTPGV